MLQKLNNKGEIASLLTIVSLVVISVGVLFGAQVANQNNSSKSEALSGSPYATYQFTDVNFNVFSKTFDQFGNQPGPNPFFKQEISLPRPPRTQNLWDGIIDGNFCLKTNRIPPTGRLRGRVIANLIPDPDSGVTIAPADLKTGRQTIGADAPIYVTAASGNQARCDAPNQRNFDLHIPYLIPAGYKIDGYCPALEVHITADSGNFGTELSALGAIAAPGGNTHIANVLIKPAGATTCNPNPTGTQLTIVPSVGPTSSLTTGPTTGPSAGPSTGPSTGPSARPTFVPLTPNLTGPSARPTFVQLTGITGPSVIPASPIPSQFPTAAVSPIASSTPKNPTPTAEIISPPTTPPLSSNPTDAVTPKPTEKLVACTFDALAYVDVCTSIDPVTGECKKASGLSTLSGYQSRRLSSSELSQGWGFMNNKQRARRGNDTVVSGIVEYPNATFNKDSIEDAFRLAYGNINEGFAGYVFRDSYKNNQLIPISKATAGVHPLDPDPITFKFGVQGALAPEQYNNFEEPVNVTLSTPSNYEILNQGATCFGKYSATPTLGDKCPNPNTTFTDAQKTVKKPLDTINGLKVGCGMEVLYGWTVQKCTTDFNYIFVVDTSSSMLKTDPYYNFNGYSNPTKLLAVKDSIIGQGGYLDEIFALDAAGSDSRYAVITFNKKVTRNLSFTEDKEALRTAVKDIERTTEGTNIDGALDEAYKMIQTNPDDSGARTNLVIFLTDGLPNKFPNEAEKTLKSDQLGDIYRSADKLKALPNTEVIAIGYGEVFDTTDPTKLPDTQLFDRVITKIASRPSFAYSTDTPVAQAKGGNGLKIVFDNIKSQANSCSLASNKRVEFAKSMDFDGNGIINTVDILSMTEDGVYFSEGENIPQDLNGDKIVDGQDLSLIYSRIGEIIPTDELDESTPTPVPAITKAAEESNVAIPTDQQ